MTLERIAELRALKAKADAVGMSSIEVAIYTREARTALPEALDALERVRRACSFDASAYLDTEWSGGDGKGMPVVPVADILAALEGKK